MRRTIATIAASGLIALTGTASATADDTVRFEAQVNQVTLLSSSCEAGVCAVAFEGSGAANHMGRITFTIALVQDFNVTPCNPYTGSVTFTGATGSITLSDQGTVCGNTGPSTISSDWHITSGTGEFNGITGNGTSRGTIGPNGPVVHFSGSVSY
jgi:hypothetical protein